MAMKLKEAVLTHERTVTAPELAGMLRYCCSKGKGVRHYCRHVEGASSAEAIFGFLRRSVKWRTKYEEVRAITFFDQCDTFKDQLFSKDSFTSDEVRAMKIKIECIKLLEVEGKNAGPIKPKTVSATQTKIDVPKYT